MLSSVRVEFNCFSYPLMPTQTLPLSPVAARQILVLEDDRDLSQLVQMHLRDAGYSCEVSADGAEGLNRLSAREYDLIVLDLTLPRTDGLEVCRRVRSQSHYTPIIMVTSRGDELDRVLGLELGADDYLAKPFSMRELLARVKAVFRRGEALGKDGQARDNDCPPAHNALIETGQMTIALEKREVRIAGEVTELTAKEFDLLHHFACHPGRVYTRLQLLDTVWGLGYEGYEHTVNSHINRLRAKIERDPAHPKYLLTLWGVGYKFAENPDCG